MGLHQLHGGRVDAAHLVGVAEGLGLPGRAGCVDTLRSPVARGADTANNRIDAVAVAFGILQTLQHDHAHTLADHGAVGVLGEWLGVARRRERLRLAEAHEHEDVVECVDAAGDDHVRPAAHQLEQGQVDGAERTRARRIHHAVRAPEIEPIGDAPGHHVAEQTGEGVLLPGHVGVGHRAEHGPGDGLGDAGLAHRPAPHRMPQPRTQRDDQLLRPRHTEQNTGPRSVEVALGAVPRVFQGGLGHDQPQELRRVGGLQRRGRDAELGRIEVGRREKRAAAAVGQIRAAGVGVEVVVKRPVRIRNVGDAVLRRADQPPVRLQSSRPGKQAAHADDGDGGLPGRSVVSR